MAKNNYDYDYAKGIASQRERAFMEVMQRQSNYDFLHHKEIAESTSEEKRKVLDNINKRLQRLTQQAKDKLKMVTMAILMIFAIGLTSCDKKDMPIEQRELITQELTLKNIYTMPQTKGFDPSTWVYEYNTAPATLTFTNIENPLETVTQSVTIQQLQAGISVTLFAGTYDIFYETTHSNTTTVDIKIDMPSTLINGTPINLVATYADFLLVVDFATTAVPNIVNAANGVVETFNQIDGFYYMYYNATSHWQMGVYEINLWRPENPTEKYPMAGMTFGHIYWFTKPLGASTEITFPEWLIDKIVL